MKRLTEKYYTIGKFADLHSINKKTLMWYNEINLLKPAYINPETGYRYYTYHQSAILETILLLRELDASTTEIRDFLENRSTKSLNQLLTKKIQEVDLKIENLKTVKSLLVRHKQTLSHLTHTPMHQIELVSKEESYLAVVRIQPALTLEQHIEKVILQAKHYSIQRLRDASYGSMISVQKIFQQKFDSYDYMFIEMPTPTQGEHIHIQPKGLYLRVFHKGNFEQFPELYQQIVKYAKDQNLILTGFAYEKGINDLVIDTIEDYITQIEIPVQVKP